MFKKEQSETETATNLFYCFTGLFILRFSLCDISHGRAEGLVAVVLLVENNYKMKILVIWLFSFQYPKEN